MKLTITNMTGLPHDTRVLIDGEPVQRLLAFTLYGDGPDTKLRVVLDIHPDEVEVNVLDPELVQTP